MNILFFIDDLASGGAQRQLVNLALEFKAKNNEVTVLYYASKDFYKPLLLEHGIYVKNIHLVNPFKRIVGIRKFIREHNYDVVITFLGIPAFIAELAGLPFRKWQLIIGERSTNPKILKSVKSRFIRLFHVFADYIVSNSFANEAVVKKVNPFLSKSKLCIIYNAIDLKKFRPPEQYDFKENSVLKIIVPASYRKLKNLLGLIEAVRQLTKEEKEHLKINWYGDKSPTDNPDFILHKAEALIKSYELEKIFSLNDVVQDIQLSIQEADAVGLFSYFEGLPNAVCEGMACGKPIIATAVSDVPLLVTNNKNGMLCNAEDISSIANALRYFIESSSSTLKSMGQISRKRAEQLFDKEIITQQYLNLVRSK